MWHVLHLWPKDRVYLKIYKSVCADRCCQILIVTSSQKCISSWPFITLTHSTRREQNQSLIEKASIFCIMSFFTRSRDLSGSHDDRFPGCKTRFKSRFHLDRQISAQIREKCRRRVKGYQRLKFLHGQDMEGKCIEHLRRRFLSQVQCVRDTSKWEWVFVAATFSTLSLTTKHLKNNFISSQPLSLPSTFFSPSSHFVFLFLPPASFLPSHPVVLAFLSPNYIPSLLFLFLSSVVSPTLCLLSFP